MATYAELVDAARRADAAGDAMAAKRFLELATAAKRDIAPNTDGTYGQPPEGMVYNPATGQVEDMRSPANPNIPRTDAIGAFALGGGQGAMFGGADEAWAAGNALFGGDYDYELARAREGQRRAAGEQPLAYYGGMIPGAANSSIMGWNAMGVNPAGKTLLGTMGKGAGIGGAEGLLWGALDGEGGAANRAKNAGKNAAVGTIFGAAAPVVVAGGAKAISAIADPVLGAVNVGNKSRAQRTMMDTLRKSGQSVDDVSGAVRRAAIEGQPEFRTMDALGSAGQRRASGVVRSGGDGAEEIAQFLSQRQIDAPDRMTGFIDDAFGTNGATAASTRETMKAARGQAADAAYSAARQGANPVDVRGAIAVIDDRIGGMKGSNVAGDGVDGILSRFRARLSANQAPNGEISRELPDFDRVLGVKQDVQDAIGVAVRAGRNNEARELGKLVSELDRALEAASDGYRAANDGFREASRAIDAIDTGAQSFTRGRMDDTVPAFRAMTPDQQAAARVGYGDKAIDAIQRNTSPTANVAKPFASTKRAAEADAMAIDPRLFADRVGREGTMWATQNRALGGSRTADNLSDIKDLGPMKNLALAARDFFTGNFGNAASNAGAALGSTFGGQNEATRGLIAQMLMSSDPEAALAQAMRQDLITQSQKRVAEGLLRAIGREVTP